MLHYFKDINLVYFIRDTGKYITVNYMIAKESVKKRLSKDSTIGMSFTEFSYQLIQAYDFYHLLLIRYLDYEYKIILKKSLIYLNQ